MVWPDDEPPITPLHFGEPSPLGVPVRPAGFGADAGAFPAAAQAQRRETTRFSGDAVAMKVAQVLLGVKLCEWKVLNTGA